MFSVYPQYKVVVVMLDDGLDLVAEVVDQREEELLAFVSLEETRRYSFREMNQYIVLYPVIIVLMLIYWVHIHVGKLMLE